MRHSFTGNTVAKRDCEKMSEAAEGSDGSQLKYNPDKNYDEATMAQQRDIEKQISESQPLVGEEEDVGCLNEDFKDDPVYLAKVKDLQSKFQRLRRTRGDGNCFFRAVGYGYLEQLLTDKEEYRRFQKIAQESKDNLVALGFPQFTIEDFHDTFMEVVGKVGKPMTVEELRGIFNDQSYSDYLVVYLRLIVSGHLQKEADFFMNFIEGERSVKEFCNQEVEPMSKESDHIHIIALTAALGISIRVQYLDRGEGGQTTPHDFPEGSTPKLYLLYRPGHYDLLYP